MAATPAHPSWFRRGSQDARLTVYPHYVAAAPKSGAPQFPFASRIGIAFDDRLRRRRAAVSSAGQSASEMAHVTSVTLTTFSKLFAGARPASRSTAAWGRTRDQRAFSFGLSEALGVLALISLSLAIINLFPFLPLDGGHIFWALAEKVRGRPIPVTIMEQASVVGIALVALVFIIGLQNDVHTLTHGGFHIR